MTGIAPTSIHRSRTQAPAAGSLSRADIERLRSAPTASEPSSDDELPPRPPHPPTAHKLTQQRRTWATPAEPRLPWQPLSQAEDQEHTGMLWLLLAGMIVLGLGGSLGLTLLVLT